MVNFRARIEKLREGWGTVQASAEYQRAEHERELDRQAHAKWLAKDRLLAMGIPLIHALDILEGRYPGNEVDAHVAEFDGGKRAILFLAGGVGSTKTSAACRWLARHGGRFVHVHDLAHASTFDAGWDRVKDARRLVIDDLGCEVASKSEWVLGKVREVLEARTQECAPCIVTTNLSRRAFVDRYGDDGGRLVDRLRVSGEWFDVPVFGSQRKTEAK